MNLLHRLFRHPARIAPVLLLLLGPGQTAHAGDSYHVCSQKPHHDLTFRTESDGSIVYAFTGELTCHVHFNYDAFHSTPHDTPDQSGSYRVKTWVKGNRVHEKIWFQVNENSSPTPSIESRYSCQANPFTHPLTQNRCTRLSRSYPHPSEWHGAVEEAASFDPLSIGLASGSMLQAVTAPAASGNPNGNQQSEDLFDPHNQTVALIQDAALTWYKFSPDRRKYHFTFTAHQGCYEVPADVATNERHPCREVEKLEALATKYIDGKRVDISIRGGGHHIDLQYQCANIMDPFLDPSNKCTLISIPASFNDSLYRDLVQRKYNLVYHFSHAIRPGRRTPMVWEALARSMRPAIFEGGKKAAPEGTKISFSSAADIVLDVESARDIRRSGEQTVLFHIKPDYGSRVSDIDGNTIAMPLTSKYTGNTYNGAVRTVKHLAPGKYTYYTSMMTSLTTEVQSRKIPFEVTSHISPKQAPMISSPRENEKIQKGTAVSFKVLVPEPMFGSGFDATLQCEHSRLAAQTPYKPLSSFQITNQGKESVVGVQRFFNDGQGNVVTGDFRCRARMVYDGKERGKWSGWRHFHVGGKAIPLMHVGFAILSPKRDQSYQGKIPVKISLPKNIAKDTQLSLFWEAVSGQHAGNTLATGTAVVQPGETYKTVQDTAPFTPWMQGSDGRIKLVAMLGKGHKADVVFTIPVLGNPVRQEEKKSLHLHMDTALSTPVRAGLEPVVRPGTGLSKGTSLNTHGINPQPEPPGKQMRNVAAQLVIMPHPRSFRPGTPIQLVIKNAPTSRVPFELRYRPAPGAPYKPVKQPRHSFSRKNGVTTLHLELKQPGEYQFRFRANHKAPWTRWSSLTVADNTAGPALAHTTRMAPANGARLINPQPEPPGKVRHRQTHGMVEKGKKLPLNRASFSPVPAAKKMSVAPPKIEQPRNGQKFLLAGNSVQVQARIRYAGREKMQVDVQRETDHRFRAIQPRISFSASGATTTATIHLDRTGRYRLRVRAGSSGRWSGWTTFNVDRLMNTNTMHGLRLGR